MTEVFCFPCQYPGIFRLVNSMALVSAIASVYFAVVGEQEKTIARFQKLLNDEDMVEIELA